VEDATPVIEFNDVTFSYDGVRVVENVTFTVFAHDYVSIVGPNGGGKTTLLKLILGRLRPDTGTVRVFGHRPEDIRPRIGYLPQHSHLDPRFPVTVMDVVLMGRLGLTRTIGPYSREDRQAAQEALEELSMWDLRRKHFSALSGGQRQRVLIARALAARPKLLLLDEPTAGLDMAVEAELYDLLRSFSQSFTVVMVSHDLGFVSQYVNKVVCVKREVAIHPTTEVTGEAINAMYGAEMKMVRHDQLNSEVLGKCITS
jgi:zinc transport system ATP-binding protein